MELEKLTIDRGGGPHRAYRRRSPLLRWGLIGAGAAALWFLRAPIVDFVGGLRETEVELATAVLVDPGTRAAEVAAASGAAANGYLVARRRAALSADTPGRIVELNVEEGTVLSEGDVVARLFSSEAEASLRRAGAELAAGTIAAQAAGASVTSARRRYEEAEALIGSVESQRDEVQAALALAQTEFERATDLHDRNAIPLEQLDRARSALAQAKARFAGAQAVVQRTKAAVASAEAEVEVAILQKTQAEASVAALEASRDFAQATLDKTFVRAPFDGVVVLKDAEVGEVVSPNALGGQSRGSVATMVDFSSLEVQVELPETSLDSVVIGRPAEVYLDAFSTERFDGTVDRIWPTANRQKATIEVRVALASIDPRMRPEMGVRVVFPPEMALVAEGASSSEEPSQPQLLIPASAVVTREGDRGVFVVEGGIARFQSVTAGPPLGRRVAIESGLTQGQRVVLAPDSSLESGDHVSASQ